VTVYIYITNLVLTELSFFPTNINISSTINHPIGNAIFPNVAPMTRAERIRTMHEGIATSPQALESSFKNALHDHFLYTNAPNGQVLPSIHYYNPGTFHELHRRRDQMVKPSNLSFRKDMLRWRQHSLSTPGLSFHNTLNPAVHLPNIGPQDFDNGFVIHVTSPTTQGHPQTYQPSLSEGLKVKGSVTSKRSKSTIENSKHKIENKLVASSDYNQNLTLRTSQELYGTSFISNHDGRNFGLCLYMGHQDDINLSPYQCHLRMQMEFFEAGPEDVHATMQGRNKPITHQQVGIRCRYCSQRAPQHRTRGSTYYPTTLEGIYQACQNMASVHLSQNCPLIPESQQVELVKLRLSKSSFGGGKHYWAETARSKGIIESNGILLILKDMPSSLDLTS
jgi:hypothetical protein